MVKDSELLSISEVGEATGVPSSALRYYEKAGLIKPVARVGGRRHYDRAVLERLALVSLLQEVGFTISEISEVMGAGDGRHRWRGLAEAKLEQLDAHLDRARRARDLLQAAIDCGCSRLDSCEIVNARRGRHHKAVQLVSLGFGAPGRDRPGRPEEM